VTCPFFGMELLMEPIFTAGNRTLCSSQYTPSYPPQSIAPLPDGTYYYLSESVLDTKSITNKMVDGVFTYNISVTVTSNTLLSIEFAFNGLTSLFNTRIVRQGTNTNALSGEYILQRTKSGSTNLNQRLSGTLRAGNYTLQILGYFNTPFDQSNVCYTYIFSALLLPGNGSVPVITGISPPGGEYLNIGDPIVLLLDFSTPLYDSQQNVVNPSNLAPIVSAFSLVSNQSKIPVTAAVQTGSQQFRLVFNGTLSSKTSYSLKLTPNQIFNSRGLSFSLFGNYRYSTLDVDCAKHGAFDSGSCYCDTGYAGRQCDICEAGYKSRISPVTQVWECAKCTSLRCACFLDSCSCEPGINPCKPLGTCTENAQGQPVCTCKAGYDGVTCQTCASGYEGYPYCDKENVCPPGTIPPNCDPIQNGQQSYATYEILRFIGLAFAIVLLIVSIAFILIKRFRGVQRTKGDYGMMINEDE